ncbi:MAG: aldehyde dehydrogenase [Flavisolibacter sp.]
MNSPLLQALEASAAFFGSGGTRSEAFRRKQLEILRSALLRHEKELQEALYADLGKNPEETWVTETGFLLAEIRYVLGHLKKWMKPQRVSTNLLNFPGKSFVYREPLGVVCIIGPWNYPLQLLFMPLIGAMAAGNTMVLKPSEFAPHTAAVMKKIIEENFPPEYILFVEGEGSAVVPEMMNAFRFDHVFYTGSTVVGKKVYEMAARQLTPVTLELGGKSPCIVESDADLSVAARRIAMTKFSNAGQMCVAPDYILVQETVREALVQALSKTITQFYGADPAHDYNYGRIINDRQFDRLRSYLQQGKILYGGNHDAALRYLQPTLLGEVSLDAPVMKEEIFGPILPILSFRNREEAKQIIRQNPQPLALYVFTPSKEKEAQWISDVPFGGGCINNASWHLTNHHLPFGGRGNSGIGRYHGAYSFEVFSHSKAIMKTPTWFDPQLKYPPFQGKLKLFKKIIR